MTVLTLVALRLIIVFKVLILLCCKTFVNYLKQLTVYTVTVLFGVFSC